MTEIVAIVTHVCVDYDSYLKNWSKSEEKRLKLSGSTNSIRPHNDNNFVDFSFYSESAWLVSAHGHNHEGYLRPGGGGLFFEKKFRMDSWLVIAVDFCFMQPNRALDIGISTSCVTSSSASLLARWSKSSGPNPTRCHCHQRTWPGSWIVRNITGPNREIFLWKWLHLLATDIRGNTNADRGVSHRQPRHHRTL